MHEGNRIDLYDLQDEGDLYGDFDNFPLGRKMLALLGVSLIAWAILGAAAYGVYRLFHG